MNNFVKHNKFGFKSTNLGESASLDLLTCDGAGVVISITSKSSCTPLKFLNLLNLGCM